MKYLSALTIVLPCLAIGACAAPVIEAASVTRDRVVFQDNIAAAQAGNAEAQFRVGNALCCAVISGQPFYDTEQAKEWLCRSAAQGYAPAMLRIARIHNGELTDGVRVMRRAINAASQAAESPVLAWTWFSFAADAGATDAASRASDLYQRMSDQQRAAGQRLRQDGIAAASCRSAQG